jgi:hypothetical protein
MQSHSFIALAQLHVRMGFVDEPMILKAGLFNVFTRASSYSGRNAAIRENNSLSSISVLAILSGTP